jgi:hypothetical protein
MNRSYLAAPLDEQPSYKDISACSTQRKNKAVAHLFSGNITKGRDALLQKSNQG